MSGVSTYVAPVYQPPHPAAAIGAILRAPRNIRHTGNFSYVFSPIREQQLEYVDGILVVSSIFCLAWVLWAFTLLVLKFKGKQVGCASGRAFVTVRSEDAFDNENKNKHVEDTQEDIYSTSKSSGDDLSHRNDPFPPQSSCRRSKYSQRSRQQLGSTADDDHSSEMLSQNSGWISGTFSDNHGDKLREFENEPVMLIINPRENRTRLCFIVYASICLLCMPLIMVFSYGPMKEATDGSDDLILRVRTTLRQVETNLNSIESASSSALEIVESTPTDLEVICPLISKESLEAVLGVDLSTIVQSVADDYNSLKEEVTSQLNTGHYIVDKIGDGVVQLEGSVATTEEYMWAIPALLFGISVLSAISIFGVIMAWKEKSDVRLQRIMSWVVLPLLILASVACWMVVVLASMGSMIGTDLCLSSSRTGSPDQTIQEILSLHNLGNNDTIYQFASAYTNQCFGPDPMQHVDALEQEIQDHIDIIWRQMSQIDSLGRSQVIDKCGDEEAFSEMLSGARNLAKLLTAIRRSLSSTERSLRCHTINPIYAETVHETICTSALTSTVNGLILFLIVSICVMVMISLRASWLRHIDEEKVYHDEDEIAENMILDEHEEYLAYISRYKHEWQEYEGFENDEADESGNDDDYIDDQSEYDENGVYDSFEGASDISGVGVSKDDFGEDPPTTSHKYKSAVDGATLASDETSCHLQFVQTSDDDPNHVLPDALQAVPKLLLPPPMNPEYLGTVHPGVVQMQNAATAPPSSSQFWGDSTSTRRDVQRRAFYGTSARKPSTRAFSTKKCRNTTSNFDRGTNETDHDMGFEVQMRL